MIQLFSIDYFDIELHHFYSIKIFKYMFYQNVWHCDISATCNRPPWIFVTKFVWNETRLIHSSWYSIPTPDIFDENLENEFFSCNYTLNMSLHYESKLFIFLYLRWRGRNRITKLSLGKKNKGMEIHFISRTSILKIRCKWFLMVKNHITFHRS